MTLVFAVPAFAQEAQPPGLTPENSPPGTPRAPDWAYPQSPTHNQVAPPPDFHRDPVIVPGPIGVFEAQADIGAALVPGSASFAGGTYTISSAGYNLWYTRDEFRYLYRRVSGDVSLAADIAFPDPDGFGDRKAVLVIRQSLDDDSPEAVVALHGAGMFHLAIRPTKGARIWDMEYRVGSRGGLPGGKSPDSLVTLIPRRLGIEKRGDQFSLWVSEQGEPMHQYGAPVTLHLDGPFYVGIGFVSHLPTVAGTAQLSNVVLENRAGRVR
ncbi:hypothetical protein [Sphingomonas sp.]|uniref:hypothetical protein n=1 Tax=Sphingomonas sp. TaxID=28214 RepID=UPI001B2E63E9|nr:hypothetical protein [Sphingomonas sp.]MBO9711517.1 hypothetical protein [Sphingomonas sp.]